MSDWARCVGRVSNFLLTKFSFWHTPPHALAVLGHYDEKIARDKLHACQTWFKANRDTGSHHRLTLMYFEGRSTLQQEVDLFLLGQARDTLPTLLQESCEMAFIMTVERSVEALHARAAAKTELMK